ncbi:MAG: 23S rRNA pseudouridine(1911/1915/1917) synthase RluD [Burkholderiales bacterium]|nr:23S rRNA pseudouridine(1911/1915/1917) synthase RluD [Burkholderiales bacterium]
MPAQDYTQNGEDPAPHSLAVPESCAGLRLDQALAQLLPQYSRARLSTWVKAGRVSVDGRTPTPRDKVHGGEQVRVQPMLSPEETAFRPEAIPLDIVDEDGALIVINKPPGLVVHPGSGNWQGTLLNALLAHAPQLATVPRAGIVHRLDKDTSGLLVIAKTLTAQTDLVRQLQARSVSREYRAVVHGKVARGGTMEGAIGRDPRSRIRMAVVPSGKPAVTHYTVLEQLPRATVLACRLETGRTHQIRVHLQKLGHPIWGDPVYGPRNAPATPQFARQALHAEKLALVHPQTGKTLQWQAPLPEDMRQLIAALRDA